MTRILDLIPTSEETLVSRVLLLVHRAVDENFPRAEKPNRQFSKTVFSEDGIERTGQIFVHAERKESLEARDDLLPAPVNEDERTRKDIDRARNNAPLNDEFAASESTDSDREPGKLPQMTLASSPDGLHGSPPGREKSRSLLESYHSESNAQKVKNFWDDSSHTKNKNKKEKQTAEEFTQDDATKLEDTFGLMEQQLEPTWVSKVTIAFLLTGIILLIYVLIW